MKKHVGRKLEVAAKRSWAVGLMMITVTLGGFHVYQMNIAASKGYTLRNLQVQLEQLNATVSEFDAKTAKMQSLATVESRLQGQGYVAVDHMEFVDVARGSYALAK
ncbi:MAG: hypothetical protein WCK01_02340 [Candidatus Uhrbacteria bacterium]